MATCHTVYSLTALFNLHLSLCSKSPFIWALKRDILEFGMRLMKVPFVLAKLFVLWTSFAIEHNLLNANEKPAFIKAPTLFSIMISLSVIFMINSLVWGVKESSLGICLCPKVLLALKQNTKSGKFCQCHALLPYLWWEWVWMRAKLKWWIKDCIYHTSKWQKSKTPAIQIRVMKAKLSCVLDLLRSLPGFILQVYVPRATKDICLVVTAHSCIMSHIIWLYTPWPVRICTRNEHLHVLFFFNGRSLPVQLHPYKARACRLFFVSSLCKSHKSMSFVNQSVRLKHLLLKDQ